MSASSPLTPPPAPPRSAVPEAADAVFMGGGVAGELLRGIDWSRHVLGRVSDWPQSLRTSLNICLTSRYPICILWGSDYTYFYNDAYTPIVGAKHPAALGAPYPQVWPEIWEKPIKPLLQSVAQTGVASWSDDLLLVLQRHGFNEECYFGFSFAPIRAEDGGIGGFFTAITETTNRVVSDRRLRTLRDLAARGADAKSADEACRLAALVLSENRHDIPFALFYLTSPDSTHARFAQALGLPQNHAACAATISLAKVDAAPWPLAEPLEDGKPVIVRDLAARLPGLPGGPWPEACDTALVLPIARPGQTTPYGFLVAGTSPRRPLDEDYRTFLTLAASQVATLVSNARAYEEERRRSEQLAEIDRTKTTFFNNVSHEFRTPLTLMLGPLEEVLRLPEDKVIAANRERVDMAYRNGLRLLKLVNTLLDFARIEAGRTQASYEPVDLGAFTTELASAFRSAFDRAHLKLEVDCPTLSAPVYLDRDMWEKIVLNLLSNAFKFTFTGGVRVALSEDNGWVKLQVRDTGAGIPAEAMAHVFERFYRVEGAAGRTHEGSGIGLALVQELVKLHGGAVCVESQPGKGSVFTVSLRHGSDHLPSDRLRATPSLPSTAVGVSPFVEEALRWLPDATPAVEPSPAPSATGSSPATVLLADDNADMRTYVTRLLAPRYRVVAAADGEAALATARAQRPDLILADIMMPRLDGTGLLQALRREPGLHDVPVIFLSARAGEESRIEGFEAGADDYLVKPFSARELTASVTAHLELSRLRRLSAARAEAAERRHREILAALPVACYTIDAAGKITFFNAAAEKLWGRHPELGQESWSGASSLTDLDGKPLAPERSAAGIALREKRAVRGLEMFIVRPDGSRRWVLPHADPLFDPQGHCTGAIAVVFDVTEPRAVAQALRLSEERLREGLDAANMGSWRVDLSTGQRTRDAGLNRILGYEPVETTLPLTDGPQLIHPDDRAAVIAAWDKAVATRGAYEAEFRIRRLDGSERWLREQGRAVGAEGGTPAFVTGVTIDITERRRASLAANHLASIVESSDDAIVSKNLHSVITSWNRGAERIFGYTAAEAVGQPVFILIPPERVNEEPEILARIRTGELIEHYETVRRRKDGKLITVSLTVSPIRDAQNRIVGASKIARDITHFKESAQALQQRTRTLEILNRVGATLVAERDLEKVVQAVTDAGREIAEAAFGAFFYNVKDAKGESYTLYTISGVPREAFSKFPMPRNTAVFAPTFNGEGVVRVGDIHKDPRYGHNAPHHGMPKGHLPVRSYLAVPVKSRTGEVLGGLFFGHPEPDRFTQAAEEVMVALASQAAIAIDNAQLYTALQRELDQQRTTEGALRESAAQLRLITDNAPVLLAQVGRDLRYKFVNQPYARRYKLEVHDFIGRDVRDVLGQKPYEVARPHIDRALRGETVEFEAEVDYGMPHLGKRWTHVTYTPERTPDGEVIGFLAVATDVTMRKQAEIELEQTRDRAVAASRAKDEFLAALSHELRTPLNPVLLLASDAAANPALSAEVRADFDAIRKNVDLEARLIDDLLDLTRITRGKLPLELRPLNLHTALQDALTIVRPEIEAKHLLLDLDFAAAKPTVWGDEVRLQQVFWNVLKNAVKFTPDSGRIGVHTSNDPKRGLLLVKIVDTGIGMTPEEQAHVFESFKQGDHATKTGSHRFGGLGLGLAISRMLVEMHSGRVVAHSAGRDQGSEFTIELPQHQAAARREAGTGPAWPLTSEARLAPPKAAAPAPARRIRVLLVEDHAPTRNTLAQLLGRRHFDVLPAASVAEARAVAAQNDFQFVISDIGLPDGDGYELMTSLRAARPTLTGIALSGYGMEEDVARSRAAGFAQHLIKPVNIGALEEAIARLVAADAASKNA